MTLCMGILSALTTGFWGAVSDRLGRTKVMSVAILGLVMRSVGSQPDVQHSIT